MRATTEAETFSAAGQGETSSSVVRVAVAGATGYAGLELLRLLARHPQARVTRLMSSGRDGKKEFPIEDSHPSLRGKFAVPCQPLSVEVLPPSEVDLVFLATPHHTALEIAPRLLESHLRVVDLSAAFRLKDAAAYPRWYGFEHDAPAELEESVYGLTELNAESIRKARLVANPEIGRAHV